MASFGQLARALIDQLRAAGTRRVLSLEVVAERAGLSKRTLEKWKNGDIPNPTDDAVVAGLRGLGLDEATAREEVRRLKVAASNPAPAAFTDVPASKRQPRVSAAPEVQRLSHYARRALEVIGRDAELARLRRFVEADRHFAWLQLAGVAGQGKSRLALELMLSMEAENWLAGFLSDGDIAEFGEGWREWQPSRPTLLIVDYVVGRDHSVGLIFRQLARRSEELRLPVRLLLIERQRWDRGGLSAGSAEARGASDRADWFVALAERHDGADSALSQTRFEDGVLELTTLRVPDLVSIVRRVAATEGGELAVSDNRIEAELARIDAAGRPLYAYFLGQMLAREPARRGWTREDLLDDVLCKDWAQRWRAAFNGAPPEIGEDNPAARLSVIATMCGGVDFTSARALGAPFDAGPSVRRRALAMTDGPASVGAPANAIPPLQPDILGEWFVLRSIVDGLPLKALCDGAWRAGPRGMARFLERLAQDFPEHDVTVGLLDQPPLGARAADAYASVSAAIIYHLDAAEIGYPATVIAMLKRSAAAENALAMTILGLCYQNGNGVEMDLATAVEWYRKGAAAGNASAMAQLGICHEKGTGVEKDIDTAANWIRKGAVAGAGTAMATLGRWYHQGISVEKDLATAVEWYRKGAAAGNSLAMTNLGLCYEVGDGVEKDVDTAVEWYRRAAGARESLAMTLLGMLYESGTGVEKDMNTAVKWYLKAAVAEEGQAMALLGNCYETGVGVEEDVATAVEWYRKAAAAGNQQAQSRLRALAKSKTR